LDQVSPDLVQAWVAKLSARVAPSTVRRTYTVLAQLLDAAVGWALPSANPTTRVRLPRVGRYEARFSTPAELERLAGLVCRWSARWHGRWRVADTLSAHTSPWTLGELPQSRRGTDGDDV